MAISGTMIEADIITMREAKVEVDIGSVATWAAIESWSTMVEPTRGTVPTSEEKTLDGINHTGFGTAGNATIRVTAFFTNDTTDPHHNLYSQLGELCEVRWSKSGAASQKRFYTDGGVITEVSPPGYDASGNQSTKFTFVIVAPDILVETIPTA